MNSVDVATNASQETLLVYLKNTYKFEYESVVVNFGRNDKGNFIVLNETIFHPQGGGQPSDVGIIEIDNQVYNINFVASTNGIVNHYVTNFESISSDIVGKAAKLRVDQGKRLNHAKSHTSGHLLSCVVEKLAPELKGVKGYHFPEGPYVEFKGKLTCLSNDELIEKAVQMMHDAILNGYELNVDETEDCQAGKVNRTVKINGYEAIPCGGTHLKNISELKQVNIRKIQSSKGNTKISYLFN
jgi:Ser-tRNA(Ala) deacylase AlaX